MSNETNETIADIVADIRAQNQGLPEDDYALSPLVADLLSFADRIEAAWKREREAGAEAAQICGEIGEIIEREAACKQSVTDCNRLGNAAIDIQKKTVAKLCELLKEFADVLNDTKSYMCFCCTIRGCPGEHECRYTKKYCLLVDKARKAIEDVKGTQHIELTKKET